MKIDSNLMNDDLFAFVRELQAQNDRGQIIVGAAYIDDCLRTLLLAHFINNTKVADDLLNEHGPLGSFAAKIELCYLLHLVDKDERHDLHIIRKMRNEFAHLPKRLTFETKSVKNRCDGFLIPSKKMIDSLRKETNENTARILFHSVIYTLSLNISSRANEMIRIEEKPMDRTVIGRLVVPPEPQ